MCWADLQSEDVRQTFLPDHCARSQMRCTSLAHPIDRFLLASSQPSARAVTGIRLGPDLSFVISDAADWSLLWEPVGRPSCPCGVSGSVFLLYEIVYLTRA